MGFEDRSLAYWECLCISVRSEHRNNDFKEPRSFQNRFPQAECNRGITVWALYINARHFPSPVVSQNGFTGIREVYHSLFLKYFWFQNTLIPIHAVKNTLSHSRVYCCSYYQMACSFPKFLMKVLVRNYNVTGAESSEFRNRLTTVFGVEKKAALKTISGLVEQKRDRRSTKGLSLARVQALSLARVPQSYEFVKILNVLQWSSAERTDSELNDSARSNSIRPSRQSIQKTKQNGM